MPYYDYQCEECEKEVEVTHGMTEEYNEPCECGGKLQKLISGGTGVIFKGSGFYDTDYKKKT